MSTTGAGRGRVATIDRASLAQHARRKRQHVLARFILVPYNIGWHLAHHVDSGVPFRNLPRLHRALSEAGYVDDSFEYPSYPAIWRALKS